MNSQSLKAMLKKIPMVLLVYFFGGAFCRGYQLSRELLLDGGLVEGAYMHRVLLILAITFCGGFAFLSTGLQKITTHKEGFSTGSLPALIQIIAGVLLIAGNALELLFPGDPFPTYTAVSDAMIRYLPWLGIVGGALVIVFALQCGSGKTPSPALYMLTSLYLVVRLIVCFQEWNMDPSAHDYAYKLLAAICAMLGCFHVGGFAFGKGKRRLTVFWCLCAAFFAAVSMPDYFITSTHITFSELSQSSVEFSGLLVNIALMALTLTHGLQLLFAPDPVESTPTEEPFPEEL